MLKRTLLALFSLTLLTLALAHDHRTVGEGENQYTLTVGMLNEPVFTELRTGLDLNVTDASGEPVEGLENSLEVTITAPNGETRTLDIRPMYGAPGSYTDDYILTIPGTYDIHIVGFIGELGVDETFPREVGDVGNIRFP